MKEATRIATLALLTIGCAGWLLVDSGSAFAQARQARTPIAAAPVLELLPVRGNVYLLHGAGANITLSIGKDGVLVVDAGAAGSADAVVKTVQAFAKQLVASPAAAKPCVGLVCDAGPSFPSYLATTASPGPTPRIRYIIDTSADADHTEGNATISRAGTTIGSGPGVRQFQSVLTGSATIYAQERVLSRLASENAPSGGWPAETFTDRFGLYFNGEGVQLTHVDAAHSDGDLIVHFRGSDVISTGDILSTESYPKVDADHGGSIDGTLRGLNYLLELVIPEYQTEGGTLLIPGHGRICDMADLASYRDAMTIIRDRVKTMMGKQMTLAQIKAAKPTKDYDPRYATPDWTGDAFVEMVYRSLMASQSK